MKDDLQNARLLVVDDEPANLRLMAKTLGQSGYSRLELLSDPREVLPAYTRERPDLILLDLNMPGMSGFEVLEQLKALNDPLLPPVIVVTAQHQHEHLMQALSAGARDFIAKPFHLAELKLRVSNALEGHLAQKRLHDMQAQLAELVVLRTSALENAENATRVKSEFLSNMSHELRTPMNAVLGMLQLLENTSLTPKQAEYVNKTRQSARSLLDILNDILDFSKVEAGKMQLDPEPFEVEPFLQELSFLLYSNLGAKPVELLFDIDPQLPSVLVADALRLKQVLINLAGNAIKFTAQGQVCISIQRLFAEGEQQHLRLSVQDSGIGIASEQLDRIFEGFSQAETSTSRRYGGTGLGLAISQRLVQLMGGELKVESQPGRGSTFYFDIAVREASALVEPWANSFNQLPQGWQVLVLEPHVGAHTLVQRLLAGLNWKVNFCEKPQELEQALLEAKQAEQHFDAVIASVDALLPQDGDWLPRIRDAVPEHETHCFLMTRPGGEMALPSELSHYVDGWLFKPLTPQSLRRSFSQWAQHGSTEAPSVPLTMANATRLPSLPGVRVLLVEDNPINQDVAIQLLEHEGARVVLAENGQEAVERLSGKGADDFDIVLMDMQMHVMDGLQATRLIRQQLRLTELPVVAMTANAMASDREACLQAGMNEHIGKPFDVRELVATVLRMLGRELPHHMPPSAVEAKPPSPQQPMTLNQEAALARLNGDQRLYSQLLRQLTESVVPETENIVQLWLANQKSDAARVAHKLKGGASVVGAEHLTQGLIRLEDSLSQADETTYSPTELLTLAAQLVAEAEKLRLLDEVPQHPMGADLSPVEWKQALETLMPLLARQDMDALDVWDAAVAKLGLPDNPQANLAQAAMDRIDLPAAQQAVADWLSTY